jgi:hypothetical protein
VRKEKIEKEEKKSVEAEVRCYFHCGNLLTLGSRLSTLQQRSGR